jgi:hypothetical protein
VHDRKGEEQRSRLLEPASRLLKLLCSTCADSVTVETAKAANSNDSPHTIATSVSGESANAVRARRITVGIHHDDAVVEQAS